jgi:DNA-binding transcriptional LysR family regulator
MLDFRIATFLAVCQYHSYTKAAAQLAITQPAVTQHIHYLEKYYGVKLFTMNGKQVELTGAGELLQSVAKAFRNDEAHLKERMQKDSELELPLKIGATITIGEFVLPQMMARYARLHPDRIIQLTIANTAELLQKLQSGAIQLALVEGYFDKKSYGHQLYSTEQFIPVVAAGHKFAADPGELKDLLAERLLVREEGSGTREILVRRLAAENYKIDDFAGRIEVNNTYTILQLLLEDAGITFVYEAAVQKELKEKKLQRVQLRDFQVAHDFTFLWNKDSIYAAQAVRLCKELGR